jgi:hypothetical protein
MVLKDRCKSELRFTRLLPPKFDWRTQEKLADNLRLSRRLPLGTPCDTAVLERRLFGFAPSHRFRQRGSSLS